MDESQVVVLNQTTSFDELFYDDNDGLRYLTPDVYQNSSQNYNVLVLVSINDISKLDFDEYSMCKSFKQTKIFYLRSFSNCMEQKILQIKGECEVSMCSLNQQPPDVKNDRLQP